MIIPKGFKGSAADLGGGCGPDGSLFDLVPDNFIGVDISVACKAHDFLYGIGGFEADKVKADKMFYQNLKRCVFNGFITETYLLLLLQLDPVISNPKQIC